MQHQTKIEYLLTLKRLMLSVITSFPISGQKMNKLYQGSDTLHLPYLEGMDTAEMAFRLTDTNKDGYVDKSEFKKMAKSLSKEKLDKATEDRVKAQKAYETDMEVKMLRIADQIGDEHRCVLRNKEGQIRIQKAQFGWGEWDKIVYR